jgi:N-terminal domain of toast_rack, DUF2154
MSARLLPVPCPRDKVSRNPCERLGAFTKLRIGAGTGFVLLAAASFAGCVVDTVDGPMRRESRVIPRDTSETARVDLRMGAGELRVTGGSEGLMEAAFNYNVPGWKPQVRYRSFAGRADLTVRQPEGSRHFGNSKYDWDLRLNDEIPMDLLIHFGAGEARLNLGSLNLRSLEVDMGVGEINLDLRGTPRRDYEVRIRGGVGEATVHLPANAGIYAIAQGGIGEIKVRGLRQEGRHWLNDVYGSAKTQIRVDVRGGIGEINLFAE